MQVSVEGKMVEVSDGASCADALKEGLSGKRFKAAIACKAGDTLLDLTAPVPTTTETLTLTPVTADTPEGLGLIRHSAAHVMAAAVKKLFPAAKVTIGPSIENGFYYDFDVETPFSPDQFEAIEAEMQRIIDAAVPFERMDISKADAVKLFNDMGEPYKVELIEGLEDGTITLYRNGDFVDLCRGPHIPNAGFVKAFKLLSVAGAYWRGDEKNRMLSRIYATAFADAKDLKEYLNRIEEAKRATTASSARNSICSRSMRMWPPVWSSGCPRGCCSVRSLKISCAANTSSAVISLCRALRFCAASCGNSPGITPTIVKTCISRRSKATCTASSP